MLTLSIIKADTGGFVGHTSVHPSMVDEARERVERAKASLLIDGQVATCGDDLSLILTHSHGAEDEGIHRFAFDTFMATTDIAVGLGLYGAGQDLLSDAFSGNLRGLGPGYAELTFTERVSEPVLCFLADKTEPGAWNLPLFRMFADPFTTPGLVIDPKMHAGFSFEVHDLVEGKQAIFEMFGTIPQMTDMFDLQIHDILANDTHAVVMVEQTVRRGDRVWEGKAIHVFHMDDGMVTEVFIQPVDECSMPDGFWD